MARLTRGATICLLVTAVIMIILAVITLVGVLCMDQLWISLLRKRLALVPGSQIYENWVAPSVPIYFYIYLFNLTNPQQVLKGGKPHFTEYGPLVYREKRERFNLTWPEGERYPNTISFKHRIWYHFVPEMSVADEREGMITSLNMPLAGLASGLRDQQSLLEVLSLALSFSDTGLFVTHSPRDFIWGYDDELLKNCNYYMPATCPTFRVGLMATSNGTTVHEYTVETGVQNPDNVGRILKYNGSDKVDYWHSKEANMINGTDGSTARPGLSIGSRIRFFIADMCRSFHSDAVGFSEAINRPGIQLLSFSSAREQGLNATLNPSNLGFCTNNSAGPPCPPTGLMPLSACRKAGNIPVPIFASQPHFYGSDPYIYEAFDGLDKPSANDTTSLYIEPMTGFILQAFKRLQINMYVEGSKVLSDQFQNVSGPFFWPLAWFREEAVADRASLDRLYQLVIRPKKLLTSLLTVVCAVTLLLGVLCVVLVLTCSRLGTGNGSRSGPRGGTRSGMKGGTSLLTTSTTSAPADIAMESKRHPLDGSSIGGDIKPPWKAEQKQPLYSNEVQA